MKSKNSTLQLFGLYFRFARKLRKSFHPTFFLIPLVIFVSLISFAGGINNGINEYSLNGNPFLNTASAPLTGPESIRSNLYLLNPDSSTKLADGVLTQYNDLFHDIVTLEDAYKFTNINENLGLSRYGSVLAIERRPVIASVDTLFFKLWKTTRRDYQFEFITINLNHPGMKAYLEDVYLGTRTLLTLTGTTKIAFTVNADAASANVNRFRIIFQSGFTPTTLPVTFASVKGYQLNNKISIDWKVENEINIDKYEVERSSGGVDFVKVNLAVISGLNNANNSYSWIDNNPINGNNFYRIRSIDRDGAKKFSIIVKITIGKAGLGSIAIYPNPIRGNTVNLQFTNQPTGIYQVRMINNNGQAVYSGKMPVSSSNISQTLFINKKLAGGIYQMEIKAPDNTVQIQKAVVQE